VGRRLDYIVAAMRGEAAADERYVGEWKNRAEFAN
jgi:hypothetical protein